MYETVIILKFNPPLSQNDVAFWQKLSRVFNEQYPNAKWSSGTYIKDDYTPYKELRYLCYRHWLGEVGPVLTYQRHKSFVNYDNEKTFDGYEWVSRHDIDYEETFAMFDELEKV